ncbi:MAG: hypothetical protein H6Q74_685 [Firmicutes bacterium]|nr:hypothetical protein [Bacillota bacterium]
MQKKTTMDSFGSEYAMSAGDNAVTRQRINESIVSKATSNEHSFREAAEQELARISDKRDKEGLE